MCRAVKLQRPPRSTEQEQGALLPRRRLLLLPLAASAAASAAAAAAAAAWHYMTITERTNKPKKDTHAPAHVHTRPRSQV